MPDPLTPFPEASARLNPGVAKSPLLSELPSPSFATMEAPVPASPQLPAWPTGTRIPELSPIPKTLQHPTSSSQSEVHTSTSPEHEFTDADLREAFSPLLAQVAARLPGGREISIESYLEPLLRAEVRRALAASSHVSQPIRSVGIFTRLSCHFRSLFSSRSYEEILSGDSGRFQVGEVFLLDASSFALVSFASCDRDSHANPGRVEDAVQQLVAQLREPSGNLRPSFALPDQRKVISCTGDFVILIAVVKGQPDELVIADFEFALHRIEDRFREKFEDDDLPQLHALQPFLEDCLLIQAPASAA